MADDKTKKVPEEQDYQFNDAACSAEFGGEGCKVPEDEAPEKK